MGIPLFQVVWQFKDGSSFKNYPKETSYLIEKAYLNKEKAAKWEEDNGSMEVIFKDMVERTNSNPVTDLPVRRQVLNASGKLFAIFVKIC